MKNIKSSLIISLWLLAANLTMAQTSRVYTIDEYHVKCVFDNTKFHIKPQIDQTSHCFCKFVSSDGTITIIFSAYDVPEIEEFSIYEEDVLYEMRQRWIALEANGIQVINNCEKVKMGNTEALMSNLIYDLNDISFMYICFQAYHKGKLYSIDFHVPNLVYDKNRDDLEKFIRGVQFI